MSKTFAPNSSRANVRGANNSRSRQSLDGPIRQVQGRGIDRSSQTQTTANTNNSRGRGTRHVNVHNRGRGASSLTNTRVPHNKRMDESHSYPDYGASSSSPQRPCQEQEPGSQQGQYVGGFTKFEPNTKKRQQVSEMARKETEEFERYKQENAVKYCNYVGTTGGGEMTEDMVRRKQANDVRNQKFNRLQNQQRRREEQRDAEQREIDLKRAEARRKADENARHDANYRAARPEDVRRRREDFLRQFESQSKATNATTVVRNPSDNQVTSTTASRPQPRHPPPQLATPPPSNPRFDDRFSNIQLDDSSDRQNYMEDDKDDKKFEVEDFPDDVMTLAAMFPDIDMTYLNSLYKDTGSVDAVLDIIGV